MKRVFFMLDMGGTEIKCGLMDEAGRLMGEVDTFPARADGSQEEIFDHLAAILCKLQARAGRAAFGVGIAIPGPFDYRRGISLMQGVGKYDAIYGIPVEAQLKCRLSMLADSQFMFLHDIEAFALGICDSVLELGDKKVLCLCLGTGAGSCFVGPGTRVEKSGGGVPENGWIYRTPYKESIIDDYLSVRGLSRISRDILGESMNGRQLYELCGKGEEKALSVYRLFGEDVKEAILPFLEKFVPDALVFGGQISKSISYFGSQIMEECRERRIEVVVEPETSVCVMKGLYIAMADHKGSR